MTNQTDDGPCHTLILLDPDGHVIVNRLILSPMLRHTIDETEIPLEDLMRPGNQIHSHTIDWFKLTAKLVEEK